jgi:hypothetical protein
MFRPCGGHHQASTMYSSLCNPFVFFVTASLLGPNIHHTIVSARARACVCVQGVSKSPCAPGDYNTERYK